MTDRQRDSSAKFLYNLAKGIGLIAAVGRSVGGQAGVKTEVASGIPSSTESLEISLALNLLDLNRQV